MRVLNDKIDFSKFDEGSVRQNEIWMPLVKFKSGLFSDTGYRFRENEFKHGDNWFPGAPFQHRTFYDVTFFSSDEIEVGTDFMTVAEMYFRVKTDTIKHRRKVFSIMDWLGAIGGIEQFLIDMLLFAFGGYCHFNSVIETVNFLNINHPDSKNAGDVNGLKLVHLSKSQKER